ncbi:MAG: CBS domain-containing protein, partial [Bacteroidales bacterium]|nr:CBS domain-containing protein [Bacteroidales bacterium]
VKKEDQDFQQELQIFQNAIDFRSVKLRECLIPRPEINAIDENDSIEELKNKLIKTNHSKILVYKESIDYIIGYIHSSDIFKNPNSVKSIIRPVPIVPETMLANNVLKKFIKQHKNIAVVVDEFGGTSGIVTMEDIIEEIIGEIEDEYDVEDFTDRKTGDNEYLFSARMEIDYINEKYKINLPVSDDYETLGGLIINIHESIPFINDLIEWKPFIFEIKDATENRIELVSLKIKEKE